FLFFFFFFNDTATTEIYTLSLHDALPLDTRGAWELLLDNGVTVRLGNRQVDERFERFATAALHLISQRATDIAYVDMRYSNGFAVGWRNAASHLAGSLLPKEVPPDA